MLWDLLKLVKQASKAAGSRAGAKEEEPVDEDYEPPIERSRATATSAKPRKNKPMNAREQEAKIAALSAQLGKFQNGSGSDDAGHNRKLFLAWSFLGFYVGETPLTYISFFRSCCSQHRHKR